MLENIDLTKIWKPLNACLIPFKNVLNALKYSFEGLTKPSVCLSAWLSACLSVTRAGPSVCFLPVCMFYIGFL